MEHALEFRDDLEKLEKPPEIESAQEDPQQDTQVEEALSQSVTPTTTPEQAAQTVSQMAPEQQQRALVWLSRHRGGLFAGQVASLLEGANESDVESQIDSLGDSAVEAVGAQQSISSGIGAAGLESSKDKKHAGKEILASYSDPLLGEFQVLFDVDKGISSSLRDGVVTVFSVSGLTLRTPEGLKDLTIRMIKIDLKTGDVEVNSDPEIGPFEEKLISNGLRASLLSGVDKLDSQADLAESLGLEVNEDGMIPLYESFWADVYLDAGASITTTLSDKGMRLYFSKPIFCDVFGPVNLHLQAIEYNFGTASVDLIPAADGSMVGVALEEWASKLGEGFANDFIRDKMPAAMKVAGYSPKKDPKLAENFNALLANMGSKEGDSSETDKAKEEAAAKEGEGAVCEVPEGDFQTIYAMDTESGTMVMAIDQGDSLDITKSATELKIGASQGLYLVAPGAEWIQDLRLFEIRYGLADGEIEISASEPVGEMVEELLESLIRSQVLPRMPGEILSRVGIEQDPVEIGEIGELEVLYSAQAEGLGEVRILADETDEVKISRSGSRLSINSIKGVHLRVLGSEWIPELIVGLLEYDTETGEIAIEPPVEGDVEHLDVGPLTERVVEAIVRTQLLPLLPGEVRSSAGLHDEASAKEVPDAQGNVIIKDNWGPMGDVDVSLVPGDSIGFKNSPEGFSATIEQGLMLRAPGLGFTVRIFELSIDPKTKRVRVNSEPPLGSYEEALLGGALGEYLMPQLQAWIAEHDEDLTDKLNVLYRMDMGSFGSFRICVEAGDSVQVQEDDKALTISSSKGLFWLTEGDAADVLPANRLHRIRLDLNTGEMTIDADQDVGELGERLATRFLQKMALPSLDPALREKIFGGKDPLQDSTPKMPGAEGNVVWSDTLGGVGKIDVSLKDGDKVSVAHGPQGIHIDVGEGVLVRLPELGVSARVFDLGFDPKTQKLSMKSEPALGAWEEEIISGALSTYVMPHLQGFLENQDDNLKDNTRVLYKADLGGFGSVKICVEESDTLQLEETSDAISVSASKGIFWLAGGEAADLLPANRIQRVRLDLKTGALTIDADRDIGALGESVATRVIQSMVLPRLDADLRDKLFGGQDPLQASTPTMPKVGQVVHEGEVGGMDFDLSLESGRFQVSSLPGGQLAFAVSQGGLLLRVPDLGMAVYLYNIAFDPASGTVTHINTHPQVGVGELDLIQAAIGHFAGSSLEAYTKGENSDARQGVRTVANFGGTMLKVDAEDSLVVSHEADATTVSAPGGILIDSPYLQDAPPRLQMVRYEHETGQISLDLVNTVDNTHYKNQREVSGLTQNALSALVRQLIDPHLTDELRGLGFAGKEAGSTLPEEPKRGETTWLDTEAGPAGRVMIFSKESDRVEMVANNEEYMLHAPQGIRLVLPDLGVEHTFFRLRYHLATDDVRITGMGRLETDLIRNAARSFLGPVFAAKGVDTRDEKGMVAQMRDNTPKSDDDEIIVDSDGATLYIPKDCEMTVALSGTGLRVKFRPKIWIDGPSFGNFYLDKIKYDFATATADVDVDGSNLLSAIFEGVGENKATAALTEVLHKNLPDAMKRPGYNLFSDKNKQANLAQLFENFGREEEEGQRK